MILFLNGPFGVGKTSVANNLRSKLPNSLIYDPEEVGAMLRNILGKEDPKSDFQHYELWPILVVQVAKSLQDAYGRDLIIPMTVYERNRHSQIVSGLKAADPDFHHFCLLASPETLRARLAERGEQPGDWGHSHIPASLAAFRERQFDVKIPTDDLSIAETADRISFLARS